MAESNGGDSSAAHDKPYDPTPQRLEKARLDGDSVRTRDLPSVAVPLALLLGGLMGGQYAMQAWGDVLLPFISKPDMLLAADNGKSLRALLLETLGRSFLALWPLWVSMLLLVFAAVRMQGAIIWSGKKIELSWTKISLLNGFKQKFGAAGLLDFVKNIIGLTIALVVAWFSLAPFNTGGMALLQMSPQQIPSLMGQVLLRLLLGLTLATGVMAALDYFRQYFFFMRRMRMSHHELKEEMRENEGDPHFKMARRERGREIALNQMLSDVATADVVITNPTHYAVALKWSRMAGTAPTVVAKGVDEIAAAIRARATEHTVPIHPNPPLARQLYADVDLGKEVPANTYKAVAAAIRFAQEIRDKRKQRGF
jgi:flagellar biosynthesis protein FlhB